MTTVWQPANDIERALVEAMAAGDRRECFRILAVADLYIPAFLDDVSVETSQRFVTEELFGHVCLLVFTSVGALVEYATGVADAYTTTNYAELRRKWPVAEWWLAVNPGTPIDVYLPIVAVEALALGDSPSLNGVASGDEVSG